MRYFLQNPADGMEALNACTQSKVVYEGRNQLNNAFLLIISLHCDNIADITIVHLTIRPSPYMLSLISSAVARPKVLFTIFDGLENGIYLFGIRRLTAVRVARTTSRWGIDAKVACATLWRYQAVPRPKMCCIIPLSSFAARRLQ